MKISKVFRFIKTKISEDLYYIKYRITGNDYRLGISLMTIDETLDYMSRPGNCIVRFGDGEFYLIRGGDIGRYQKADPALGKKLREILTSNIENLLVCLPEPIVGVDRYRITSKKHWILHNKKSNASYGDLICRTSVYGNSFVSRPYMIYADKSDCGRWFEKFKSIFIGRDIVIIEGVFSRTGVGNDFFDKARSLNRILCPPNNAYESYDRILEAAVKIDKKTIVLVALGPAGKVLTYDLAIRGYWVIDIGHIDSEYEWYKMGATQKVPLNNKHSAEHNDNLIGECNDQTYQNSIITIIE